MAFRYWIQAVLRMSTPPWIASTAVGVAVWLGLWASPTPAFAQTLNLSLSPSSITFASADPDTTPSITAPGVTVTYRVRNNASGNWQITLLAGGDLTTGSATIPISLVTWTATPVPPFRSGTLSRTVAQSLASGSGNVDPAKTGTVAFSLENRWTYNTGTYTASVQFTLVAP
jgi:hypothetical protein